MLARPILNYEALDPSKLKTLGDLVKLMGHEDRTMTF
jgi:hypothetical protein